MEDYKSYLLMPYRVWCDRCNGTGVVDKPPSKKTCTKCDGYKTIYSYQLERPEYPSVYEMLTYETKSLTMGMFL